MSDPLRSGRNPMPHLLNSIIYVEKAGRRQFEVKLVDARGNVTSFATCLCRYMANEVASAIQAHSIPEATLRLNGGV